MNLEDRSSARVEDQLNKHGDPRTYLVFRWYDEDRFPVKLVISKARLVLRHIQELKDFVGDHRDNKSQVNR